MEANFQLMAQVGKLLMLYMLPSKTLLTRKPVTHTSVKGFRNVIWYGKNGHYNNIRAISNLILDANGIQISTNRGRFWLFQTPPAGELRTREEAEEKEGLQFRKLEVTPGTTIVGFYAVKVSFRVSLTLFLDRFIYEANSGLKES